MADTEPSSSFVANKWREAAGDIRQEQRNYWLNHAFILGHQWLQWHADRNRLEKVPQGRGRIRATFNRMRANTRTTIAQVVQRDLVFQALPPGADDSSVYGAKVAEAVLRGVHMSHHWEEIRERSCHALWKGGTTAIAVEWDTSNDTSKESLLSVAEFVVEPGSVDGETARWWIKNQLLPPKEVQALFPEAFPDAPPAASTTESLDPYQLRLVGRETAAGNEEAPLTRVLTYYERPNPLAPEGRFLVEVDGKVVQHGDWPFPWSDRLNIAIAHETKVESRWAGRTVLDDARPLQIAYNVTMSALLEHIRDAGVARLAVETPNEDLIRNISDRPGEVMTYHPGSAPPSYVSPPQMPGWIGDAPGRILNELDNLMGVHDVSRGIAPGSIESGLGVQILAEADATPVGRMVKETTRQWERVARMVVALHAQEVSERRTAIVPSSYGPETLVWTGDDIEGQQEISIPLDAVMPRSRAAARQVADQMAGAGLIKNIQQYAKVAELPNSREILDALSPDHARALRENHKMALGDPQIPMKEDNHAIHIESHLAFMKSEQYEQLGGEEWPQEGPDGELMYSDEQEYVRMHIEAHRIFAAEEAAEGQSDLDLHPAMAAVPSATGGPGASGMPDAPALPTPVLPSMPEEPLM